MYAHTQKGASWRVCLVRRRKRENKRGIPVPAAKQLLQGSSSPLNLSHLLFVLRHWSQAEESKIRWAGQREAKTGLCCSFSYWTPRLDVGHRRICRDHGGKALQTWRRNSRSRERRGRRQDRRTSDESHSSALWRRPLPGCWLSSNARTVSHSLSSYSTLKES
jgi:hypothetical protein